MENRLLRYAASVAVAAVLASSAHACDGYRKGFTIGGGFGGGVSHITSDFGGIDNEATRGGPGLDVRIGYAPTDRLNIFLGGKIHICYLSDIVDRYDRYFELMNGEGYKAVAAIFFSPIALPLIPFTGSHMIMGLGGVTYYLEDEAPAFFFEATFGASIFPDEFEDRTKGGFGFSVGLGYEFVEHWNVRCDAMFGFYMPQGSGHYYDDVTSNAFSAMLTLNYLFY